MTQEQRDTNWKWFRVFAYIFLFVIVAVILTSCGNLKKTNTETNTKTDSNSVVNIDATKFSKGFTLEPVDLEKPILIGGKEYFNTKATFTNTTERIIYKDSTSKKVDLKQEVATKEKDYSQLIESIANKLFWLIIVIVVLFIIVGFIKKRVMI